MISALIVTLLGISWALKRVLGWPILVWPLLMPERLLESCQSCAIQRRFCVFLPLLVASSNKGVSTDAAGRWTYLTTLPLMKTFLTELYSNGVLRQRPCSLLYPLAVSCHTMWGYLRSSITVISSSLMLRYWSTLFRVPRIEISFLSSTVTSCMLVRIAYST